MRRCGPATRAERPSRALMSRTRVLTLRGWRVKGRGARVGECARRRSELVSDQTAVDGPVHNRLHFLSLNISCMSLAGVSAAIPRFTYSRRGKSANASGGFSSQCDRMMPTR